MERLPLDKAKEKITELERLRFNAMTKEELVHILATYSMCSVDFSRSADVHNRLVMLSNGEFGCEHLDLNCPKGCQGCMCVILGRMAPCLHCCGHFV